MKSSLPPLPVKSLFASSKCSICFCWMSAWEPTAGATDSGQAVQVNEWSGLGVAGLDGVGGEHPCPSQGGPAPCCPVRMHPGYQIFQFFKRRNSRFYCEKSQYFIAGNYFRVQLKKKKKQLQTKNTSVPGQALLRAMSGDWTTSWRPLESMWENAV